MLSKIALNAAAIALSALTISAAPAQLTKQSVQIYTKCVNSSQVALTFDDGPFNNYEQDIASHLAHSKSNATFFLNGHNFGCIYEHVDEVRALHAAGSILASHSFSHHHMTTLSIDQMHDELARVEEAYIRILGLRPRLFRPPYGEYNEELLGVLQQRGYTGLIKWNQDTRDGSGATPAECKGVYDQVGGGDIVLEHSVYNSTANDVVPYGINVLKNKGLDLVALDVCLGMDLSEVYEEVGNPQNGTWHC